MKKILVIGLTMLLIITMTTGCKKEKKVEAPKNQVMGETIVEGLKISGISIVYENNKSMVVATVENLEEARELRIIEMNYYIKEEKIGKTVGYIGKRIEKNEKISIVGETTVDVSKADRIEYKIEK